MEHRHITPSGFSLAAIDDVIARGSLMDWLELRDAARADRRVMERIARIAKARVEDPYAQRYHLWKHYVEKHGAAS
jgi:hypothetical protein